MHEYIMRYLMHHEIRGASIFEAMMGYGARHHLHMPRKLGGGDENPLMILVVDSEQKIRSLIPHLREILSEGLMVVKKVETA